MKVTIRLTRTAERQFHESLTVDFMSEKDQLALRTLYLIAIREELARNGGHWLGDESIDLNGKIYFTAEVMPQIRMIWTVESVRHWFRKSRLIIIHAFIDEAI